MPRRPLALLVAPALVLGAAAIAAAAPAAAHPGHGHHHARLPGVYPVPQSMHATGGHVRLGHRVAEVVDASSDPDAVAALRTVLTDAGVRHIDSAPAKPDETAIYVGASAGAGALKALHVADASTLRAEGYVLADGRAHGRPVIVLDGHDGTGTFYAVQTLRQLIEHDGTVPGVAVRDWPAQPVRGVIEGFYGTPWSDAQRLAQLDFYGAHKMNSYVYSPKNDPYLRDQWRDPYPPDQLAAIKKLVDRAAANDVQFTYALSPGLSICYSSASDEQALVAKFQSLWDIGVRSFSIPLDDISYTSWNCAADQAKFGMGGGAAGAAQAYLLNEVQKDFIATHPGAQRLQMVPTEYSDVADSPYKTAIRDDLDPAVVVGWTGVGVIAPTITTAQAQAAKAVYGHDILLWDNYPVNDYVTDRLLLGPYVGRSPGLASELYGITANPMIEPEASKIALFNVADYTWNDTAYDAQRSWHAALRELAGPDPLARQALAAFADLEHYSEIDPVQAPVLAKRLAAFWPAWESGDSRAAGRLDGYLAVIARIPATLTDRMHDPEFVTETQPWLDSAGDWGEAARAALRMLVAERSGDGAAAVRDRQRAEALEKQARSYTYSGLNGTVHVTVGDGVIDTFLASAFAENDRWLGLAGRHVTATTSMPTYESYVPANMVDGDPSTYFWASRTPSPGDYVGVDLGTTQSISAVTIQAGDAASPNDYIHVGVLEYSTDGSTWTSAGTYVNTPDITATLPAGTQARYVRLRATESDGYWVKVHEFTVTSPGNEAPTVTGTPAPASGSSLAAAADGNVDTAYTATSSPAAGDALIVTLPKARPLGRVEVVGSGQGRIEVETGGTWTDLGQLSSRGYTELGAGGATVTAVRLVWTPGSPAPTIAEVVPRYADTAAATLTVTPAKSDTTVGTPVRLAAQLTATQPFDETGTLRVAAPDGLRVRPSVGPVTLPRGAQQSITLTATGSTPGSYPVAVTFTPARGAPVSDTVTVTVHPAVSATNVALAANGGVASASSVEDGLPQFTPDHADDGDLTTRWSSNHDDNEWWQVKFAQPQHLGKVVIVWEAAHANEYRLETSTDGTNWTTATTVTGSLGGTETVWLDASDVTYLRMQGVSRSTIYGYSMYELEAYPIA